MERWASRTAWKTAINCKGRLAPPTSYRCRHLPCPLRHMGLQDSPGAGMGWWHGLVHGAVADAIAIGREVSMWERHAGLMVHRG